MDLSSTKNVFVTPFLAAVSLTAFIGGIVNAVTVVKFPNYSQRDHNLKTVTIWLGKFCW
jgi:hypothetical protein